MIITVTGWKNQELPPHARRIRELIIEAKRGKGTTSACAENTLRFTQAGKAAWNYLRMRGEYITMTCCND